MRSADYWQLFLDTGAPEAYMMYANALKSEDKYVFDNTGNRPAGNGLQ